MHLTVERQGGCSGTVQLLLLGLWSQQLGKGRTPASLAACKNARCDVKWR